MRPVLQSCGAACCMVLLARLVGTTEAAVLASTACFCIAAVVLAVLWRDEVHGAVARLAAVLRMRAASTGGRVLPAVVLLLLSFFLDGRSPVGLLLKLLALGVPIVLALQALTGRRFVGRARHGGPSFTRSPHRAPPSPPAPAARPPSEMGKTRPMHGP